MKKQVLLALLVAGLGTGRGAQAQVLERLIGVGIGLGTQLANSPKKQPTAAPAQRVASSAEMTTAFQQLTLQRTAPAQLPRQGADAIADFEAQLERCHLAFLADSASPVCPPAQRAALQQVSVRVMQANSSWNTLLYQREAAFYIKEDARRQLVASGVRVGVPAPPAKPPLPTVATAAQAIAQFRQLQLQRTAPAALPAQGAEAIGALERELDRCQAALQADSTGTICPTAQRTALQQASRQVAQANSKWNLLPYQREASFYLDEDVRRQLVRTGAAVPATGGKPKAVAPSPRAN